MCFPVIVALSKQKRMALAVREAAERSSVRMTFCSASVDAASMRPMIATTIISSMMVKPAARTRVDRLATTPPRPPRHHPRR